MVVGLPQAARAQQNLFNVPSGQITRPGELFFQQQLNLSRPLGTSNTTLDVGLGHGWEAGINLLDVVVYDHGAGDGSDAQTQVNPDVLANVQKGGKLADFWRLGVGTQIGFNPNRRRDAIRLINFSWVINALEVPNHEQLGKYYVGAYFANTAYAGPGNSVGFLLGAELPIIKDRLSVQADWVGGRNEISVLVLGGVYTLRNGWQISLGAQLPAPRSPNPRGGVTELTLPGVPVFSRGRP